MSIFKDFIMEDGVLVKYVGDGGDVVVPEGVTEIGEEAFECCDSLTSVRLADTVKRIGDYAFCECRNLTSVIIPDSVREISYYAFQLCTALINVTLGKNVTAIRRCAFELCNDLGTVYYNGDIASWCGIDFDLFANPLRNGADLYIQKDSGEYERVEDLVIPESVMSIGYEAFYCCTSLSSVKIGNGVTQIGTDAFGGSSLTGLTIGDNTHFINPGAFAECYGLKTVILGSGLTRIYVDAFFSCDDLECMFYHGTETEFKKIQLEEDLASQIEKGLLKIYYYSEEKPVGEGLYWRYVDGVPTAW